MPVVKELIRTEQECKIFNIGVKSLAYFVGLMYN